MSLLFDNTQFDKRRPIPTSDSVDKDEALYANVPPDDEPDAATDANAPNGSSQQHADGRISQPRHAREGKNTNTILIIIPLCLSLFLLIIPDSDKFSLFFNFKKKLGNNPTTTKI